jgi:glucosyl-3-phosphoglycerate synthase
LGDDGRVATPRPVPHHSRFSPAWILERKAGRPISVCIPARDEAATIGPIVACLRRELVLAAPVVDEILVVDDGSGDATPRVAEAAGARVVSAGAVLAGHGDGPGKGQAMWKGLHESQGELVAFCDADVTNFSPHFVVGLLGPLLEDDGVALVKASYRRTLDGDLGGGRVTELVAKPLLATLFPELAHIHQPLAGEAAGRRQVLEQVPFCDGYAVELGLLIDVARRFGPGSIAQVDLGVRSHRNRPLAELRPQAEAILKLALRKAGLAPGADGAGERPPLAQLATYRRGAPSPGGEAR